MAEPGAVGALEVAVRLSRVDLSDGTEFAATGDQQGNGDDAGNNVHSSLLRGISLP